MFRALQHRNYRLFFGGQTISLVGTWMQRVATGWLVYRLTNSALSLGLVGFAGQMPIFVFAPIAGVVADRWNRHRILIVTQTLALLQAMALAILVMTRNVTVWQIVLLSMFLGFVNAFDMPARQSFVIEMIENKEDLGNAIALNSSMVNGARLVGPAIAGVLVATAGEGVCFLLNGISYLAVIAALLAMRISLQQPALRGGHIFRELKEGFAYAFRVPFIRSVILLVGLVSLVGLPYQVLMPVFARKVLQGGPQTLGFLSSAAGTGALVGAIYLASRQSVREAGRNIPVATGILGLGLIAFSQSTLLWFSLLCLLFTGFGVMLQVASSNTALQVMVDDSKRGRVMSLFGMAFVGAGPFGSLLVGALSGKIGARSTVLVGGVCCLLGSFLFAKRMRPVRERVGLADTGEGAGSGGRSAVHGHAELTQPPRA
jgi:MFS family permease